eukprot:Phypoly_transcript_07372.p1 GENE.Phypoly_transcript_07372~~Phypoly_transcript_07372.p1  ORF type:complete len:546 (+),score=62.83 Phypoly_transcript_07372:102-1640(+)
MAFDTPQPSMRELAYHKRFSALQHFVKNGHPFVQVPTYEVCSNRDFVESMFHKITTAGGEGIILRDPRAPYLHGYSRHLYKHKGFSDAEALVLERLSYKRFLCRVHKAHLHHNANRDTQVSQDKSEFYDIEMSLDEDRFDGDVKEIATNSYVSFRYFGQLSGIGPPIDPRIYMIRSDITSWEQLLHSKRKPPTPAPVWKQHTNTNDWSDEANHRKFFDEFAKSNSFDPLIAENWYQIDHKQLVKKAGGLLVHKYDGSYKKALMQVYPNIGIKEDKFLRVPRNYWASKENRRKFFNSFASSRNFEPLIPQCWYNVPFDEFNKAKGGAAVLNYYGGYACNALMDLYPNIGLIRANFSRHPWSEKKSRKVYFDEVAASRKFDPLVPSNWHSITYDQLLAVEGGAESLAHYDNSATKALADIYQHEFPREKFTKLPRNRYASAAFRKLFFDQYASTRGFNPHVADNWYAVDQKELSTIKEAKYILSFYSNSMVLALCEIYPNIGLQHKKFLYNTPM